MAGPADDRAIEFLYEGLPRGMPITSEVVYGELTQWDYGFRLALVPALPIGSVIDGPFEGRIRQESFTLMGALLHS